MRFKGSGPAPGLGWHYDRNMCMNLPVPEGMAIEEAQLDVCHDEPARLTVQYLLDERPVIHCDEHFAPCGVQFNSEGLALAEPWDLP